MEEIAYKAYISFDPSDAGMAEWVQHAIEDFRAPPSLKLEGAPGSVYRDRGELSAGDELPAKLRMALLVSEYLVVICSPRARESRLVNLEIQEFRELRGEDKIICVIVDGERLTGDRAEDPEQWFPLSLFPEENPRPEIIAADMRSGYDSPREARLALAARLMNVDVKELEGHDVERRRRNLLAVGLVGAGLLLALVVVSLVAG